MSEPVRLPVLQEPARANLPTLYQRWSDELFGAPLPGEREATCAQCAMIPGEGDAPSAVSFNPNTKCCTYLPEFPNFLVGLMLRDEGLSEAGRRSVEERIAQGGGVTPMGLFQNENYRLVYSNTTSGFGRSEALLCPHYVNEHGGLCGVWAYREATCTTWFCKHERGLVAKNFWNRYKQLLGSLELGLARHCYLALEPEGTSLELLAPLTSVREHREALSAAELDHGYDRDLYLRLWGRWAGREQEYFRACAEVLGAMSAREALAAAGSEAQLFARIALEAHRAWTSPKLPERVRLAGYQVLSATASATRVQSYSYLDPLDLPEKLVRSLHLFDGRPLDESLAAIDAFAGEPCPPEAVQKLLDFRILVAASS